MQSHGSQEFDGAGRLRGPRPPVLRYALGALAWAAMTFVVCLIILIVTKWLLPPQYWGVHTGLARFQREMSLPLLVFWVVIYSPILETFLGQLLPLEILRRLRADERLSVAAGAILWFVVHYLSGGLLHGIVALGSGAMFSLAYLRYRSAGVAAAYSTTTLARACNNILLLIAVAYGLDA